MLVHVLGWTTVGTTAVATVGLSRLLWRSATRPWTWQRKVPVPKLVKQAPLSPGSDYVGLV